MNPYQPIELSGLPSAEQLQKALLDGENSEARTRLALLFDRDTFVETGVYTKRAFSDFVSTEDGDGLEGVITGYGAIDGKPVFAFAQDATRMEGMIDERHAMKIERLYALALKNGAPVIGIFDATGTDVFSGAAGLAAYGRILAAVHSASGKIPQIALISGSCIGLSAAIAALFDFPVKEKDAELYVSSPDLIKTKNATDMILTYQGDKVSCAGFIRTLISFLPVNAAIGTVVGTSTDKFDRMLGNIDLGGDGQTAIAAIADSGVYYAVSEGFAPVAVTAFATVAGIRCGVVATSHATGDGRLTAAAAKKIARFVRFCDAFSLPVITLVDSDGLTMDSENENAFFAPELARLGSAYCAARSPKVTVLLGHAVGAPFVLLGSKALGADIVYALDSTEVCVLPAEAGVAFAWERLITPEKTKEVLIDEWRASVSSPVYAASSGEIDDVIPVSELRARICSALLMLCCKGTSLNNGRTILPL